MGRLQAQLDRQSEVLRRKMEEVAAAATARAHRHKRAALGGSSAGADQEVQADYEAEAGADEAEAWLRRQVVACAAERRLRAALDEKIEERQQLSAQAAEAQRAVEAAEAEEEAADAAASGGDPIKARLARLKRNWDRQGTGGGTAQPESTIALRSRSEALKERVQILAEP